MNLVKKLKRVSLALVIVGLVLLTGCKCSCKKDKDDDKTVYYNNETDAIVFSSQELDKVFNPYYRRCRGFCMDGLLDVALQEA